MVCTAVIWGSTYVVSKFVISFVPATVATSIRWGLAAIMIIPIFLLRKKRTPITGNGWRIFLHAFIGIALYNLFLFIGLSYTNASDGSIIVPIFIPIITIVLAAFLFEERFTKKQLIGLFITIIGTILFFSVMFRFGEVSLQRLWGDGLLFLTACCGAIYGLYGKRLLEQIDTFTISSVNLIIGAFCLFLFAIPQFGTVQWRELGLPFWIAQFYLALFTCILANFFYFLGIKYLGAAKTSIFNYLVPVFGLIFSVFFLDETITVIQIVGASFMILGVWAIQYFKGIQDNSKG
jgi:drug/metabolite transporter (DMT)-like permease